MHFGVQVGKFLGFYLREQGIEANSDKCRAFMKLPTPKTKNWHARWDPVCAIDF